MFRLCVMRHCGIVPLMNTTPQLVSSPQAARILCVSARTVHRMVAAGDLTPAVTAPGGPHGAFLFDLADVEKLRESIAEADRQRTA